MKIYRGPSISRDQKDRWCSITYNLKLKQYLNQRIMKVSELKSGQTGDTKHISVFKRIRIDSKPYCVEFNSEIKRYTLYST